MEDRDFMLAALELAREAAADGEVPVGCVITESGSHEELMKAGGMYSQLYTTQTNIARNM